MNYLVDCFAELKRLRDLQYESDFNDLTKKAQFYKMQADSVQKLMDDGQEVIPLF